MAENIIKKRFFKRKKTDSVKNREKLGKKKKSPSINRKITDSLPSFKKPAFHFNKPNLNKRTIFFIIAAFVTLALVLYQGYNLYETNLEKQKMDNEKQKITDEVKYWQNIVGEHKDYRDGYFRLAMLEYRLKDYKQSKTYLEKTLEIDPMYDEGRKLEALLSKL